MKPAIIKKTIKTFLILLILSTTYHLSTVITFAQVSTGLSVIPPRLEVPIKADTTISQTIKVRNESSELKTIKVSIRDFVVNDNKGTPTFLDENSNTDNNRWAASTWIQVFPTSLVLKPGETKGLRLTILPPANALPGGHYAAVVYSPDSFASLNTTGASIQTNVGTLVYVTIDGDVIQDASVKSFTAPKLSEFGPINFKATVKNSSDIHIQPRGAITINNWFGKEIDKLQLSETNIFPYTTRDYLNTLNKKWLFGRYKANFEAYYGTAGGLIPATLFFWVIPWRLLILIITAVVITTVLIIISKNKPKKTKTDSSTQVAELEKELEILKSKYKNQ